MQFHLTPKSSNAKTGPIPVSTTSSDTCPDACSFKAGGCYAKSGPLALHWRAIDEGKRGTDLSGFCQSISALPDGQLWRLNQAGDLPGNGSLIDTVALDAIVGANTGKRGFTYTHYNPRNAHNAEQIKLANLQGLTVNLSAESLTEADELADLCIAPVVTVLNSDATTNMKTPAGRTVVVCPATQRDDVTCATCQLCQRQRSTIVGFPAHGTGKKKVVQIFLSK